MILKNTLQYKLVLFTSSFILATLVVVGIVIDVMLGNFYDERAQHEIEDAYVNIHDYIRDIEGDMSKLGQQVSEDELVVSTISLINTYQDINDYQSLIFDEEKKKLANYLLNHMDSEENEFASIYGRDGKLIAYAISNEKKKIAGIVSYANNEPVYLIAVNGAWQSQKLSSMIKVQLPVTNGGDPLLNRGGMVVYQSNRDNFSIEHHRLVQRIYPDGTSSVVGLVNFTKLIDENFIREMSDRTDAHVSLLLGNENLINGLSQLTPIKDIERNSGLFGGAVVGDALEVKHNLYYLQSYVLPAENERIYLLFTIPKADRNEALRGSRLTLILIYLSIALLAIVFAIYRLNKLVTKPLQALTDRASEIEEGGGYPVFPVNKSSDEMELLGNVLNKMVGSIKSREEDLRKSQYKLKEVQHLAKIGNWEMNCATGMMEWSDEVYEIYSLDSRELNPSYETYLKAIPEIERASVEKTILEAKKGEKTYSITHSLLVGSGPIKYVHERIYAQIDAESEALILYGTIQDFTEQKLTEEMLRRTQKMDALGKLTGGIAHDFNNMLGVILGYSELLQGKVSSDPKIVKYVEQIHSAGERARILTQKLLAFSRMKASAKESTDINKLLLHEKHMIEKTLTPRIELIYELSDQLWPVNIDKAALEDAILNICINSMHAIEESGSLTIATRNTHMTSVDARNMDVEPGDFVMLSIADTGSGMNEETRNQLFDPFFTTKGSGGTGLGMTQVYGSVRQSNGAIHVYSEPGHGTEIIIYLPRLYAPSDAKTTTSGAEEGDVKLHGSETILVVDDEKPLREMASEILSDYGYRVFSAADGKEALDMLHKEDVDLVLSDVIMPVMDGYQLADRMRDLFPNVKIQMASGFNDNRPTDRIKDDLVQNQLQKPYMSRDLLLRIRKLLDESPNDEESKDFQNLSSPQSQVSIVWSDEIITGIDVIDADHKRIVSLFDSCHRMIEDGEQRESIGRIVDELVDYTNYHFRREEFVMEFCEYPELRNHRHMHQLLINQVKERIKEFEKEQLTAEMLLEFLIKWLEKHIIGMDKMIAPYCKGKEHHLEEALNKAGLSHTVE